ncbi:hypothetical protein Hdeb2414_s0664g00932241 [Helianthus debilis subsp. tardiflorus]
MTVVKGCCLVCHKRGRQMRCFSLETRVAAKTYNRGLFGWKRKAAVVDHHVWQSSALMRHNIDSVPPVQLDVNGPVFA